MKTIIITLIFSFLFTSLFSQVHIGNKIKAMANEGIIGPVSLSSDGTRFAFGSIIYPDDDEPFGEVKVFDEINGQWIQVSASIDVESSSFTSNMSSDGTRVAVGTPFLLDDNTIFGQVKIYEEINSIWMQVGENLIADENGEYFGLSVSLSADGTRLAVGAPSVYEGSDEYAGLVRIYDEKEGLWTQVGLSIEGESVFEGFGYSVCLSSDGARITATGSPNFENALIRTYEENNGLWEQIGETINGEKSEIYLGASGSISSDGSRVAFDVPSFENPLIRIYEENNGLWEQIGNDFAGFSGSLSSDGTIVAIGALNFSEDGLFSGQVRIYQENNGSWEQIGEAIDGEKPEDYFGGVVSISSNGSRVASAALSFDENDEDGGYVKVFQIPLDPVFVSELDSDIAFDVFPNPSKGTFHIETSADIQSLIVTDLNGKVIKNIPVNGNRIHILKLEGVNQGVYLLQGKTKNAVIVKKLFKF